MERVWGARDLAPLYPPQDKAIGEVWFQTEPPLPLLIKFIFTTAALSVQVHPNDAQARAAGLANGKTEMWHILRAAPGANVALGFRRRHTREEVRAACLDGSVERLLHFEHAFAGATFFTRANTVHALGAGLTLVEIQQHSDTTYRLYDYGRPRELHLDAGLAVADLGPWQPEIPAQAARQPWKALAACEYFRTEKASLKAAMVSEPDDSAFTLFITLDGAGTLAGRPALPGQVWLAPAGTDPVEIVPSPTIDILRVRPSA